MGCWAAGLLGAGCWLSAAGCLMRLGQGYGRCKRLRRFLLRWAVMCCVVLLPVKALRTVVKFRHLKYTGKRHLSARSKNDKRWAWHSLQSVPALLITWTGLTLSPTKLYVYLNTHLQTYILGNNALISDKIEATRSESQNLTAMPPLR